MKQTPLWRQGSKCPLNVWEGDNPGRPICMAQTAADAKRIVQAVNFTIRMQELDKPEPRIGRPPGKRRSKTNEAQATLPQVTE